MKMMYMMCVVIGVWLGGLVTHSEACTCLPPPPFEERICDNKCGKYTFITILTYLILDKLYYYYNPTKTGTESNYLCN